MARRVPASWTALTVTAAPQLSELLESFLLDQGAPGLQIEDAADGTRLIAHFTDDAPLTALAAYCAQLAELHPGAPRPHWTVATISDDGWAESWKQHFPPLAIGARLFVHPPWIDAVPAGRVPILLDPGMAFGTGHHASTRGCLELLEGALAERPSARVLDFGCGSGILAIAAVKLGARVAWAVDLDLDACAVAAENAAVNGVGDAIHIAADLAAAPATVDVVLANLFAHQLVDLARLFADRLAPGGIAIGAGILTAEAAAVRAAWQQAGLRPHGEWTDEGWVALAYRRPA